MLQGLNNFRDIDLENGKRPRRNYSMTSPFPQNMTFDRLDITEEKNQSYEQVLENEMS